MFMSARPLKVQITGVFVELPSTDLLTNDGERVFFQTQMPDISGSCDVVVAESAALALSGVN